MVRSLLSWGQEAAAWALGYIARTGLRAGGPSGTLQHLWNHVDIQMSLVDLWCESGYSIYLPGMVGECQLNMLIIHPLFLCTVMKSHMESHQRLHRITRMTLTYFDHGISWKDTRLPTVMSRWVRRAGRHTKELAQTVVDAGPSKMGVGAEDSMYKYWVCWWLTTW